LEFDPKSYANYIREDSAAFARAAGTSLDAQVPSCPGWTVGDLVAHLTVAHFFWRLIAERHVQDRHELDDVDPPAPDDPVQYFLDHAN
jgi:Mycothiol maleylpyruvate isomerase N-terminal domain